MTVIEQLSSLKEKMNANPKFITEMNSTYQFELSGNEKGIFQIVFANGEVDVVQGEHFEAKCSMTLSDKNFLKLINNQLNPTMAYMTGKLKVKGDLGLALKLQSVLKNY
ncbi:MAG TPA: SCP2 sterol-binding domain-containing protein [Bacilli bacterium]|nr:SCP2 sterol-binding domain-containing protein [Bacilli bacterium]